MLSLKGAVNILAVILHDTDYLSTVTKKFCYFIDTRKWNPARQVWFSNIWRVVLTTLRFLRKPSTRRHDTQHNDTQHNDTQHNDTQHKQHSA